MNVTNEQEVLEFWKSQAIYEASKKQNAKGKPFYMMDGPPYATGHIHLGTALNKTLKDVALRMKRLQGYDVFDRPGYDTHGIPIELQVEKEIGSTSKHDIEKYGVKKFIERCRTFATQHIDIMNGEFQNLGIWMDWDNPYLTLSDEYIEAIWHSFKEAHKKNLLYLGKYPVHVCTRCETAVAYNEIEYGTQKDSAVYLKFPLVDKKNTFFIVFTTTPWTLPANAAIMAGPKIIYEEIEVPSGERWIIAKERVPELMQKLKIQHHVKKEWKGSELEGQRYRNPLAPHIAIKISKGHTVVLSDRYVSIEEGTGLVHCAPGHGKEDYEVGKEYGLDMPCPVGSNGILDASAGKYAGKKARVVDSEIIEDLKHDGYLVGAWPYEHEYPLCWRDKSPLLMIAQPQWFLRISEIHKKLLKANDEIEWNPDYMKLRMKAWLEGIGDWPISRQRYWGTPLPIWKNEETGEIIVVGSLDELRTLSGEKKIDLHKPAIDSIQIKTKKGIFKRIPEVLDVWFDSGASSWAALGFPSNKKKFDTYWPAQFNVEGKDQFRGWWNSQLILSMITFGKKPFESANVHGMILDISKRKMSKSLGNVVAPAQVIQQYGRDYLRYYLTKSSRGEDMAYDEKELKELQAVFRVLTNINTFVNQLQPKKSALEIEDKWIISKFNTVIKEVTQLYNSYKFSEALQKLERFLILDLSKTYVQLVRERSDDTFYVLDSIRKGILTLFAPVIPFTTEIIWQDMRARKLAKEESVHLSSFPGIKKSAIDTDLEQEFEICVKYIETGLRERDRAAMGLKWPLQKATLSGKKVRKELLEVIARQLNVKEIALKNSEETNVVLDLELTPELEAEGFSREIARRVQAERKNKGFVKTDIIELTLSLDSDLAKRLKPYFDFIKTRVNAKKINLGNHTQENSIEIKGKVVGISFKKV